MFLKKELKTIQLGFKRSNTQKLWWEKHIFTVKTTLKTIELSIISFKNIKLWHIHSFLMLVTTTVRLTILAIENVNKYQGLRGLFYWQEVSNQTIFICLEHWLAQTQICSKDYLFFKFYIFYHFIQTCTKLCYKNRAIML